MKKEDIDRCKYSVGMMAVYIDRSIGLKSFGEDLKINQLDELIEVIESTNVFNHQITLHLEQGSTDNVVE